MTLDGEREGQDQGTVCLLQWLTKREGDLSKSAGQLHHFLGDRSVDQLPDETVLYLDDLPRGTFLD